jgi:hypothetical protein
MRTRNWIALLLAATLAACASGPPPTGPLPISTLATAAVGGGEAPCREVLRDATGWARRWAALGRSDPPPTVDFGHEMVLVACLGARRTGGYGIEIVGATLEVDALVVTVRESAPPAGVPVAQVLTAPFHAVRVERRDLPLRWISAP